MISIVITTFKEPNLNRAIEAILNQDIKESYELIVADPYEGTANLVKRYKQVKFFKDPGKGKSYALNLLFKKLKGNIWIFTDGDVTLSKNSINEMLNLFKDPSIGCVSGRPVSLNSKNNMLGYWSHFLSDVGAHLISRKKRYEKGEFLECSGYFFAFRNKGIVKKIPVDVAEDSIIPYMFWKRGYKIGYAEKAIVYVKHPFILKDFIKQRTRTAGSHSRLKYYAPDFPSVKSFFNEVVKGGFTNLINVWSYPRNLKEFIWTLTLFPIRLYIWLKMFYLKRKRKEYKDGWEKAESTR